VDVNSIQDRLKKVEKRPSDDIKETVLPGLLSQGPVFDDEEDAISRTRAYVERLKLVDKEINKKGDK
jgi:hypothetical protein